MAGLTFDGTPFNISLEDTPVGIGSSARIFRGYILGGEPLVVALKVFGELLDGARRQLLVRELHFAREVSMSHPSILAFLGTADLGGKTAIVSSYMINGNLMEYIKCNTRCDKKKLIIQVAQAVEFLHVKKKLVHGDLKCENVLVSDLGDALLTDFGLSSFIEKSEALSTTMTAIRTMHTLRFAAPELLGVDIGYPGSSRWGDEAPPIPKKTTASDVYAFGMLILQAVSEQPPWGRNNQFTIIRRLSAGEHPPRPIRDGAFVSMSHSWWDTCRKCWSFTACNRPPIGDVLRTLEVKELLPCRELPLQDRMVFATYTPDGATIIGISSKYSIVLVDIAKNHIRHLSNDAVTTTLAVSPDGRHIACCVGVAVQVLDAASGVQVISMNHDGSVTCVAYSRDGTRIASGTSGGTVRLWSAVTGDAVGRNLEGHTGGISAASFSPDGIRLASASDDGTIRLWDIGTCARTATLELSDHLQRVGFIQFSPDGADILAAYQVGRMTLWDLREWRTVPVFDSMSDYATTATISRSGKYVAEGDCDGNIRIWDVQDGKPVGGRRFDNKVLCGAFSPDGKDLLFSTDDGKFRVWELFD